MKHVFTVFICFVLSILSYETTAQFSPPAGIPGSTAIYKDSSVFVSWATNCQVNRGLQDISIPTGLYANVGDSSSALGMAGLNGVVSLGDGGFAVLQFSSPILDDNGADFAVFENSFDGQFLELAFVEVSSDGINFFRFPAVSNTDTTSQTWSFALTDATKINNLAGKYSAEYGTPFDLADIPDNALLNKQAITHVKIIDVVGCIQNQYCTRDINGHKINDPWPTDFGSGGFDLDAVGVIHQKAVGIEELQLSNVSVFPNPASDVLFVNLPITDYEILITNCIGEIVLKSEKKSDLSYFEINNLKSGVYFLTVISNGKDKQIKFVKF